MNMDIQKKYVSTYAMSKSKAIRKIEYWEYPDILFFETIDGKAFISGHTDSDSNDKVWISSPSAIGSIVKPVAISISKNISDDDFITALASVMYEKQEIGKYIVVTIRKDGDTRAYVDRLTPIGNLTYKNGKRDIFTIVRGQSSRIKSGKYFAIIEEIYRDDYDRRNLRVRLDCPFSLNSNILKNQENMHSIYDHYYQCYR